MDHDEELTAERALFERDGARLVPSELARGPWRPDALHGGAVAALLAAHADIPDRTVARFSIDLLAPVRFAAMALELSPLEGGSRVARRTITLQAGDTVVARARCLYVRETALDLPEAVPDLSNPFAGVAVPDVSTPRTAVAEAIGWEGFDSAAVSVRTLRSSSLPHDATGIFVNLLVPVIAGEATPTLARAAAAADYGSNALQLRLPFHKWSYVNAELTMHLARRPRDSWIGVISRAVAEATGCGTGTAQLYDEAGQLGRAAQALVVESR